MKLDREVVLLERAIAKSEYPQARKLIEMHLDKFKKVYIRSMLSMEALALLNCVIDLNDDVNKDNKDLYSRETQLIIQHINMLAREFRFAEIKRFSFLQKELLSNPKIYNSLNADAKALIAPPKQKEHELQTK